MTDYRELSALEIITRLGELPACFVRRCEVAAVAAACVEVVNDDGFASWRLVTVGSEAA